MKRIFLIVMLIAAVGLVGCPHRYDDRGGDDRDRGHDYNRDRDNRDRGHDDRGDRHDQDRGNDSHDDHR